MKKIVKGGLSMVLRGYQAVIIFILLKIDVNEKLGVGVSDCLFLTTFFLSLLIYLALK